MMETAIFALVTLAAGVFALENIWTSKSGTGAKLLWSLTVLLLPLAGFVIWFAAGPRAPHRIPL